MVHDPTTTTATDIDDQLAVVGSWVREHKDETILRFLSIGSKVYTLEMLSGRVETRAKGILASQMDNVTPTMLEAILYNKIASTTHSSGEAVTGLHKSIANVSATDTEASEYVYATLPNPGLERRMNNIQRSFIRQKKDSVKNIKLNYTRRVIREVGSSAPPGVKLWSAPPGSLLN